MLNNAIILGDSYSTFEKYVPAGQDVYYYEKGDSETDITNVRETWWYQVVKEAHLNLVLNDSWSGATIGYTGYNNLDCSKSSSFIHRLHKLIEHGFFDTNEIDTVFVFGGTNDDWAMVPLGVSKYENWSNDDLYFVLPAISYFFKILKNALSRAEIYCLINTGLKSEISDEMKTVCEMYNIIPIELNEIDKSYGHPTIKGMKDIAKEVLSVLKRKYNVK